MRNYLCLSIDGLQSGMIGAYGNTWIQTPTLDALACQSALFDRFYASSMELSETFTELWKSLPTCHKILLTDDSDVFLHERSGLFDEKHRWGSPADLRPPLMKESLMKESLIEDTRFYRGMATIADLLRNQAGKPFLLWAHFEGFRGHWDFPLSYREQYQIDEDPDPYAETALPEITGDNIDPDVKQSIAEAYSGGVTVLDETLAGLLAFLQAEGLDRNTVLLFMSVRGFSLGEHNRIGCNDALYGENVHLPLMIRFPDGFGGTGFRSQTLVQVADVGELLQFNRYSDVLPEEPTEIHASLRIGNEVIITPDWFVYRKSSGDELYVKPDDRWEINNVADRCPHILAQIFGTDDQMPLT